MSAIRTVLVVDDDDHALLLRTVMRRVAPSVAVDVVETGEGAAAWLAGSGEAAAGAARAVPSLLLLELLRPGMGGFGLLAWCREREALQGLPRVVLSSSVDPGDREQALALGACAFHSKALDVVELGDTLAGILERWAR